MTKYSFCLLVLCLGLCSGVRAQGWTCAYDLVDGNEEYSNIYVRPNGDFLVCGLANDGTGATAYLLRLNAAGDTLFLRYIRPNNGVSFYPVILEFDSLERIYYSYNNHPTAQVGIRVFSAAGDSLNDFPAQWWSGRFLAEDDGIMYGFTDVGTSPYFTASFIKYDWAGNELWAHDQQYPSNVPGVEVRWKKVGNGFYSHVGGQFLISHDSVANHLWQVNLGVLSGALSLRSWAVGPGNSVIAADAVLGASNFLRVRRFDGAGNLLWQKTTADYAPHIDVEMLPDGTAVLAGRVGNTPKFFIRKYDTNGQTLWQRTYPPYNPALTVVQFEGMTLTADNGMAVSYRAVDSSGTVSLYVMRLDANGLLYPNRIAGQVVFDTNADCANDPADQPLLNWIVRAESAVDTFYATTSATGLYEFQVDTGTYMVRAVPATAAWGFCADSVVASLPTAPDTATVDFQAQPEVLCPDMRVELATDRVRPCFTTRYSVYYHNAGTVPADPVTIRLVLPSELDYEDSDVLPFAQTGDTLWFDVGAVGVEQGGGFYVDALADCDSAAIGQTLCTEAHIYPDTLCLPGAPWLGAHVEVGAECKDDTIVRFTIRNTGAAATSPGLDYVIIVDDVVLYTQPLSLQSNSVFSFSEPATGQFWRLEADQEPGHPGFSQPSVWVEGCGGPGSTGFVLQYPSDDGMPFADIDCQEVINSFDPNDKTGFPYGYGPQRYIEPGTDLTYRLRFQNTGTDTAYTVVLRDTLPTELDPASLQAGAASHPYTWRLYGQGILEVRFDQIFLPDSNVNEPASHGFFQFRLRQRPGLVPGTEIRNHAGIYFDFNAPVLTNTTIHRIEEDFVTVLDVEQPGLPAGVRMEVWPNPALSGAEIRFTGDYRPDDTLHLVVRDLAGRPVYTATARAASLQFNRGNLPDGLYFLTVSDGARTVASGKLILH